MVGKEYSSEKKDFIDEKTGRRVWQLTSGQSNNFHFYFTDNSFTLGDQEIYFLSDRASVQPKIYNLFRMDLGSGKIVQLTDEALGIEAQTKSPDSDVVIYVTDNKIKKLDTRNLVSTVIYEEKKDVMLGHPHISPNKQYIGMARNERINIYRGANYHGFREQMFATKKGWITLAAIDGSKITDVFSDTHWLGHFQFSPQKTTLAMFCHEGPWNLVEQRIWLLDIIDRSVVPCCRQEQDDSIGHEFWTRDGLIFFDNRRKGHDGTITSDRTQATVEHTEPDESQTPYIGLADEKGEVLKTIPMPYYCNHYHADNDNTLLVGDQVDDLVLIDLRNEQTKLHTLCNHQTSWYTQHTHCHPTFSWNSEKILYTSDKGGACNLYLIEQQDGKWI